MDAESLARRFHETYERLAPQYGYETRPESATTWEQVPRPNRRLMVATAAEVLEWLEEERRPRCDMAEDDHAIVPAARWLIGNRLGICPNRWYWLLFGKGNRRPTIPDRCRTATCDHGGR